MLIELQQKCHKMATSQGPFINAEITRLMSLLSLIICNINLMVEIFKKRETVKGGREGVRAKFRYSLACTDL